MADDVLKKIINAGATTDNADNMADDVFSNQSSMLENILNYIVW